MCLSYVISFTLFSILKKARWSRGNASSYHGIAPGSIPGVGRIFDLPVVQADIAMDGYLVCLNKANLRRRASNVKPLNKLNVVL